RDGATGRLGLLARFDLLVVTEDDRRDGVLLEVEREAERVVAEVEQLGGETAGETVDPRDAVTDLDDGADVDGLGLAFELLDLRLDDVRDLGRSSCHALSSSCWLSRLM